MLCARLVWGTKTSKWQTSFVFVMEEKHIVVFLFIRLIAPKRQRHIVLILAGFGTSKHSERTALWNLVKIVNTQLD